MPAQGFTYGGQTILSHPVVVETILPFLLVFTIVFAVLQKSKIFGEGKRQIDAIVALVVGLLVISFAQATGIIVQLIPFLAVSLVIILILLLLLGSFHMGSDFRLHKGIAIPLTVAVIIAIVWAVLYVTNAWQYIFDLFILGQESNLLGNVIFIVIIIGSIIAVILGGGKAAENKRT